MTNTGAFTEQGIVTTLCTEAPAARHDASNLRDTTASLDVSAGQGS